MSQAHRPTWNPTLGKETKSGTAQVSKWGLASHTKLKFRQPGQTASGDVARRDLRAELAAAERIAQDKKRKAAGLPPLAGTNASVGAIENGEEDEEVVKRRKILELALEEDRDDSESEDEVKDKGKGKAEDDEDEDDDSDDDSDDDDDTAALMAELARIKQERAEEKARLDAENNASAAKDREEEIATGNPLLNLQGALGVGGASPAPSSTASFAVKRRWDDDLIFKNQAVTLNDKPKKGEFVNDLLRSEFHKKFMQKYVR